MGSYQAAINAKGQYLAPDGTVLTSQTGPNSWAGENGSAWALDASGNPIQTKQGDSPTDWWTTNSPQFTTPQPYQTPTWGGDFSAPPKPDTLNTPYQLPTLEQAQQQPGYEFGRRMGEQGIQRSAAAKGTVLNPGTVQALSAFNNDYATQNYGNVVNQGLAARNQNLGEYNTTFDQAFRQYAQKYGEFVNQAGMGLTGYQTNVNNQRNSMNDFWSQLKDLNNSGLQGISYTG